MLDFITERTDSWIFLKNTCSPIFIYGMGDGALKIMRVMKNYKIPIAGIFASDEFVRGHSFEGYSVHKLSEIEDVTDDFVIVLAFAAGYKSLADKIYAISQKHTVIAPDVPVFGEGLFTWEYCQAHSEEIEYVYNILADDMSKKVFAECINYKISGKIELLLPITTEKDEVFRKIIKLEENEIYMDLGAYDGDTVTEFIKHTQNRYNKIYAVEPSERNYKKLTRTINALEYSKNIFPICSAAWSKDEMIPFSSKAGRQASVSSSGTLIEARSADSLLDGELCTFIKMDVEGAEREAIKGMEHTVKKYAPKLIISLYHKNPDIFELPILINRLNPLYKLYIRHQLYIPAWETNLYATL